MAISTCFLKWYPIWITFLQVHVHRWALINLNSNGRSQKSHDFKSPVFPRGICYSCTDSFLGVIKTFLIPFKTFVKRCFISWRSSCLAAGLVFENRNDISVESTWAGYSSRFSKLVSKFREVLRGAVGVTLIYWHPPTPCPPLPSLLSSLPALCTWGGRMGGKHRMVWDLTIRRSWRLCWSPRRTL